MEKKHTIGIDIRPYLYDKSGIGQYVYQLTKSLLENDEVNDYVIFADREFDLNVDREYKKVIFSNKIPKVETLLFHLKTIFLSKKYCDEYLTASSLYVPAFTKNFAILIIHDLVMLKLPELHNFKTKVLTKLFLKKALNNAKTIIAVSENTKQDILEYFPKTEKSKIHIALEGANFALTQELDKYSEKYFEEVKKKFNINQQYILFVGTIQPRKNVLSLVMAYEKLRKENKTNMQLVLVGKKGWKNEELENYINNITEDIKKDIIITGFVSEKEKAYIYKNAFVMVYPSFYEGFGLPVLESMTFNIPFITSNTSSLPEVAGDAGILIDPYKYEEIYNAVIRLLNDQSLYQDLKHKGEKRMGLFDWNEIAKSIIQIY